MANCTSPPDSAATDAGVAGTGVILSFVITAAVALVISATLVFQEQFSKQIKPSVVRRKLLNAYSDQQILTGIGIQSVGLRLVSDHTAVDIARLLRTPGTMGLIFPGTHRVLRWLRQFLMFVNLALSSVYGGFVLKAVERHLTDSTLPISCVWDPETITAEDAGTNVGLSYFATIAVIAANAILFAAATWYLHSRNQKFYRTIQLVGLVLMTASAVGATVRVLTLSQAFGEPSVKLSDEGERTWSFGTLLSLSMLLLPVVSVIEILRGEVRCAPPVADDDDKTTFLGSNGNELHTFQPNPFWGSQNNLIKK
ncbi:hypothetical protein TruAng_011267 [Truncatella angustata]|nr:hypothetical protein TruAng_011267 [Truncatella angustata]